MVAKRISDLGSACLRTTTISGLAPMRLRGHGAERLRPKLYEGPGLMRGLTGVALEALPPHRRNALLHVQRLLDSAADGEHQGVLVACGDDLQADGKAVLGRSAGRRSAARPSADRRSEGH